MFSPLGCVIPVGPDFRDPDKVENLPPFFTGSEPYFETMRTAPQTFTVKVRDRNPLDKLYVRWVSDYPEYQEAFSRILYEDNKNGVTLGEGDTPIGYGPIPANCADFRGQMATHRLVVIIADRPFLKPEEAPNTLLPFNAATLNAQPIMAGWTVTCQ